MITIFVFGFIAAAGMLLLLFKLGKLRRVLHYDVAIDVLLTIALCILMAGTFTGVMIALVAGFIITVTLFAMRKMMGTEKPVFTGWKLGWKRNEPTNAQRMWG